MPTDEQIRVKVAALERERHGYELRLAAAQAAGDEEKSTALEGRIEAVDEQLAALTPKPDERRESFNPADHTVDEVVAHAATLETVAEVEALISAELDGQNRTTLTAALTDRIIEINEAAAGKDES